jgi:ribosomal protein L16 Arg81 hydroxylase
MGGSPAGMAVDSADGLSSVAALFAPLGAKEFLTEFYGRKALRLPGDPGRFARFFSWDVLNQVIESHRPQPPRLRVVKLGQKIDPKDYSSPVKQGRDLVTRLDWRLLHEQLRAGATLKLDDVDEMHEPLARLCRGLELELCNHVQVNVYAGWFEQQGFETHWDDHDVFIAQIAGPKHWRVFEPTRKFPITEDYKLELAPPAQPWWEGDLEPGEILYIPRGWWHDAVPRGEPTLHLTFGMYRETGLDLAKAVVASLAQYDELRQDLPRFAPAEEQRQYLATFRERLCSVLDDLTLASYFREVDAKAPARIRPSLPQSIVSEKAALPDTRWLHWLPPRQLQVTQAADEVVFEAMGCAFKFKQDWAPVLIGLAARQRTRFGVLCSRYPRIGRSDLQMFVLDLVSSGLVAMSDGSAEED